MKKLNEETIEKFIAALGRDDLIKSNNPKVGANARLNSSKNEIRNNVNEAGDDYWEGGSKGDFFKKLISLVPTLKLDNEDKTKLSNLIREYFKITPEHEYIKSNKEIENDKLKQNINKENQKNS